MKKFSKLKLFFLFASLIFILYFCLCYFYIHFVTPDNLNYTSYETSKLNSTINIPTVEAIEQNSLSLADILENASNYVVGISKLKNNSSSIFSYNFSSELGIGTGILVSENGYILSNSHVTGEKFSSCYVTLDNGNVYDAKVLWSDTDLDLSICKINANNLPFATLGNSSSIRIGQTVYAIGNPIGYEFRRTVTSGIISGTNRTIKLDEDESSSYMTDLIQTDATINPGNSGGPLILPDGSVIGINTVKISSAEGIGFAVPINVVKPVIDSFKNTGTFEEAQVGILAYDTNVLPYLSSSYTNFSSGIYVVQINPTGPASSTDLAVGDIINSIDGITLNTMNDFKSYIYTKAPGDIVTLNITRNKINKNISIALGKI
ncbi:MAG: trypsin-like peptidase domain-containing protein [Clostridia bacterium]|nr:trypsin-like peptidase domain-containing protein [Clostridia bacterium]